MTVYISGPVTGVMNYKRAFLKAAKRIRSLGGEPIIPPFYGEVFSHHQYMVFDLALLEQCDCIYLLEGWRNSKGCQIEMHHAINRDKHVYIEGENDGALKARITFENAKNIH